jgi:hypothetical protein
MTRETKRHDDEEITGRDRNISTYHSLRRGEGLGVQHRPTGNSSGGELGLTGVGEMAREVDVSGRE